MLQHVHYLRIPISQWTCFSGRHPLSHVPHHSCVRFHSCVKRASSKSPCLFTSNTTMLVLLRLACQLLGCHLNSDGKHGGAEIVPCRPNAKEVGKNEDSRHQGPWLDFLTCSSGSHAHIKVLLKPMRDTLGRGQVLPGNWVEKGRGIDTQDPFRLQDTQRFCAS